MTKLVFKSAVGFMEYCNTYFSPSPKKGEGRPAFILPNGSLDVENHVTKLPDGRFRAGLFVCGSPKAFFLVADTPNPGGDELQPQDLVLWLPVGKPSIFAKAKMSRFTDDKRSDWIGFIVAKIAPEFDSETGQFTILSSYR